MGLFDHFPYTNVHELNLDWVLSMMKALEAEWEAFTAGNSLQFANPMLHDISKTYAKNTIVLDSNGNAYVSLQAVPVGVSLSNQDYWLMVFDYEAFIEKVNKNFTARYYRDQYRATAAMAIGDWLTVDDVLCKAISAIAVDDVLEVGVNIVHFTLEDFIKAFMQSANQTIQQYKNDIDASELLYRQQLAQDIANTTNSLQAQLDAALNGITADSEVINARVGADGITYSTLGEGIRTVTSLLNPTVNALTGTLTQGYVNTSGGRNTGNPGWRFTDYLPIWGAKLIYHIVDGQVLGANGYNIAFFDEFKVFISGANASTAGTVLEVFDVPDSAKYVVISNLTAADWANSYIEFADLEGQINHVANMAINNALYEYGYLEEIPLTMTLNQGYVKADGSFGTDSNWRYTPAIPVRGNQVFIYFDSPTSLNNSVGYNIAFFDDTDTFISGDEFNNAVPNADFFAIPSGASSVRISSTATSDWSTAYVILPTANSALKIVAKDGSGEYNSVSAAVNDGNDGDIIIVKEGIYTNEHIKGWGKTLHIIGLDPSSTIITCADNVYNNEVIQFSSGTLKNLTFTYSAGSGYVLHSEDSNQSDKSMLVENCKFIKSVAGTNAVGIGMYADTHLIFKDCVFDLSNAQGSAFYLHDSNDPNYAGDFYVDFFNCEFHNKGNYIMQLQSQEMSGSMVYLKFKNNTFYSDGLSPDPTLSATNYYGGTGGSDDFLGLINWRLDNQSTGNNFTILNVLPTYTGI